MLRTNGTGLSKRRLLRLLPCLFGGVVLAGAVWAEQPQTAAAIALDKQPAAAPTTYRVINLGPGEIASIPAINASGQVAFSLNQRAWFYDGTATVDIGTLGGPSASAAGLNNAGQVAGASSLGAGPFFHAFVWTKRGGMIDLGTPFGFGSSGALAINNRGQVAGNGDSPDLTTHAFRWSAADGMEDLGLLSATGAGSFTSATAINDAGLVAGWGSTANSERHAFAWTRKTGLIDLGTLGGATSFAEAVDAEGQVAGYSLAPGSLWHAFIWNRRRGMKDLGTAGGSESFALGMSANGHVAGVINIAEVQHAFSWTRASGMVDLGTLGGTGSRALRVNNKGQVVGGSTTRRGDFHAFVWTAREGMVDLNKRLRHAPAGLVVDFALAISDNGSIVATSNAGLVLLKPDCGCKGGMHTVGPIVAADMVEVGATFDTSVSFAGADMTARHYVIWSWGDGSGDRAGNARGNNGAGSASGGHTYMTPGIYTMTANVVDLAGNSATVSRSIVAYDRSRDVVGGSGWFMSPQGANRKEPSQAGKAAFGFVSPSGASAKASSAKAELQFHVGTLSFRSENLKPVTVQGARGRFEGRGTINGKGDYQYTFGATSGAATGGGEPGRFDLRIWHTDPATKAVVVDYDNQIAGSPTAGSVVEGKILLQQ